MNPVINTKEIVLLSLFRRERDAISFMSFYELKSLYSITIHKHRPQRKS